MPVSVFGRAEETLTMPFEHFICSSEERIVVTQTPNELSRRLQVDDAIRQNT